MGCAIDGRPPVNTVSVLPSVILWPALEILVQLIRRSTAQRAKRFSMTKRRRKKHRPEEIVAKLLDADAMLNAGKDLAAVLQALEISNTTLDRWRAGHNSATGAQGSGNTPAHHRSDREMRTLASTENPLCCQASMSVAASPRRNLFRRNHRTNRRRTRWLGVGCLAATTTLPNFQRCPPLKADVRAKRGNRGPRERLLYHVAVVSPRADVVIKILPEGRRRMNR